MQFVRAKKLPKPRRGPLGRASLRSREQPRGARLCNSRRKYQKERTGKKPVREGERVWEGICRNPGGAPSAERRSARANSRAVRACAIPGENTKKKGQVKTCPFFLVAPWGIEPQFPP